MTRMAAFNKRSYRFFSHFIILSLLAILSYWPNSFAEEKSSFFSDLNKRKYISIVGSSTVYPFTAIIAEKYGKRYKRFKTPTVEATGTGGGMKLFCSGIGHKYPDFANASRQIKQSEIADCQKNNIKEITEIKIGYDGIVIANSKKAQKISLTKTQIFFALAHQIPRNGKLVKNDITKWSQINKNLPDTEIRIYGPPPSSGTRDAFVELVLENYCVKNSVFIKYYPDKKVRKKVCHSIRSDGHFIEAGENDNLILQKLRNDSEAFGIFGFGFLEENKNMIQAVKINYVEPSFNSIIKGKYSVSRPLYIYFKKEHFNLIPGMKEFVQTILSRDTIGKNGYLAQKGLVPLSDYEVRKIRNKILKNL